MKTNLLILTLTLVVTLTLCENLQAWSHQTEEGKDFTIDCAPTNPDREPQTHQSGLTFLWFRHGEPEKLFNDSALYRGKLFVSDDSFRLTFTPVTSDLAGIYLCKVFNGSIDVGIVVKGLNIGGPKYDNLMDKYRSNIITGAVAGGAVMFLVLSVCFIDHFRYLSPEQKDKRRNRKQPYLTPHKTSATSGVDNMAMDTEGESHVVDNGGLEDKTAL